MNPKLSDDVIVDECMERLISAYPQIDGYTFERIDDMHIQILMWGNDFIVEDEVP